MPHGKESRRWWECGAWQSREWTFEGGLNQSTCFVVGADGHCTVTGRRIW